jgi:hypothetical protein
MLPRRRREVPLSAGYGDCVFNLHVAPRGRIGERPPRFVRHPATGFRLPAFGHRFEVSAPGLRIRKPGRLCLFWLAEGAKSPLAGRAEPPGLHYAFTALLFRPIPVGWNLCAWDCKVTPASCACQEGNTIGCIPSNDGLGARSEATFSTPKKTRALRFVEASAKFPFLGLYLAAVAGVAAQRNQEPRFSCRALFTWASSHQAHVLGRATAIAKGLWQFPANSSCSNVREERVPTASGR